MSSSAAPSAPLFVPDLGELAERTRALAAWRHDSPQAAAADEAFWRAVGELFAVDRGILNLNNGGVSPSPRPVLEAQKRYLDHASLATAYTMWQELTPRREEVRRRLAEQFGCDAEEIAISRNASEALQTCQLGYPLKLGDEVLTTTVDYERMMKTWKQRVRRDGIVVRTFPLPVPAEDPDEIVELFAQNLTPAIRLLLISHIVYLTGQVLPVARIAALARERGVPVVVDGAHAFAHLLDARADL
ncbi:MAG TPA: aminotransferase class V-fold PLP-dependent enzyme, partial [Thermoanaerobaculia bacterium]